MASHRTSQENDGTGQRGIRSIQRGLARELIKMGRQSRLYLNNRQSELGPICVRSARTRVQKRSSIGAGSRYRRPFAFPFPFPFPGPIIPGPIPGPIFPGPA
jgi:hypothetical protein